MDKIKDTLRFIFISPELLLGLALYVILIIYPALIDFTKQFVVMDKREWFAGIAISLIYFNYKYTESILNPKDDDIRKTLKKFPGYWKIKNRLYFSIFLSIVCFLASLISLYYYLEKDSSLAIVILLLAYAVSLTTSFTIALVNLSLKDIIY